MFLLQVILSIELNLRPVTQGNNPHQFNYNLDSIDQHGLRILDVGGAGDCFLELFPISCMVNLAII